MATALENAGNATGNGAISSATCGDCSKPDRSALVCGKSPINVHIFLDIHSVVMLFALLRVWRKAALGHSRTADALAAEAPEEISRTAADSARTTCRIARAPALRRMGFASRAKNSKCFALRT
jgi:hypothetical protein